MIRPRPAPSSLCRAALCCALIWTLVPTVSGAAEPPVLAATPVTTTPLVSVELGGWARVRGQWINGGSLGNGTSGLPASLGQLSLNEGMDPDTLGLSELRMRLEPALLISNRARLDTQLEIAGGLVFGGASTDDSVLGNTLGFAGNGRGSETVTLRRAWATFDLFGLARLLVGRTPDHFGLGLWRNDGRDRNSDFQSDVDRVAVKAALFGLRLHLSRDALVTLPVVGRGLSAHDPLLPVTEGTDVIRWLAQVEGGVEGEAPGLRWGVALSYQDQDLGLRLEHEDDPLGPLTEGCIEDGSCAQLVPRNAVIVTSQAYVGWRGRTRAGELSFEAEGVLRFASLDNSDVLVATDTSKTFIGGGAAGRLSLQRGSQRWLLRAGFASGDSAGGFGVLDRANLTALDPVTKQEVHRSLVTGVAFHRGFLVDGLLFREVIGAVANAWYARPSWRTQLVPASSWGGLGLELGCVLAGAASRGATPGKRGWLGIEPELRLDGRFGRYGRGIIDFSYLMPGAAFDAGSTTATDAWRLSASWIVDF